MDISKLEALFAQEPHKLSELVRYVEKQVLTFRADYLLSDRTQTFSTKEVVHAAHTLKSSLAYILSEEESGVFSEWISQARHKPPILDAATLQNLPLTKDLEAILNQTLLQLRAYSDEHQESHS